MHKYGILDHHPVILQVNRGIHKIQYPYKFNYTWLREQEFNTLIREQWSKLPSKFFDSLSQNLVNKIKFLKSIVIKWEIDCKKALKVDIMKIEEEIENIYNSYSTSIIPLMDKIRLLELEIKKSHYLKFEENTWSLKSRALWLEKGVGCGA